MIFEHAILSIQHGREEAFEAAFANAPAIFARAKGCHDVQLRRCIEEPSLYELLIGWDDVEAHTVVFRETGLWAEWRALVGEYFATPPSVGHYRVVAP